MECERLTKIGFRLAFQLFVGLFGELEMIFLMNKRALNFGRLFGELFIGFSCGLSFSRRISGRIWILEATDW
jgi:hypothetical protein